MLADIKRFLMRIVYSITINTEQDMLEISILALKNMKKQQQQQLKDEHFLKPKVLSTQAPSSGLGTLSPGKVSDGDHASCRTTDTQAQYSMQAP